MAKLTDKQRAFVENYLQCWNASESARRAGYSKKNADVHGSRLLVHAGIRAEIDARLKTMAMSADEVLARLSQHAKGTLEHFIDGRVIDLTTEDAKLNFHLLKKAKVKTSTFKRKTDGETVTETDTEIEIHDPQTALVQLGRYHKLFVEKVEHSGKVEGPPPVVVYMPNNGRQDNPTPGGSSGNISK